MWFAIISKYFRLTKSRRLRWRGHVWRREIDMGCWWGNPKAEDHLENLGVAV